MKNISIRSNQLSSKYAMTLNDVCQLILDADKNLQESLKCKKINGQQRKELVSLRADFLSLDKTLEEWIFGNDYMDDWRKAEKEVAQFLKDTETKIIQH